MSLRDRLGKTVAAAPDKRQQIFAHHGVTRNPYPPAGEPTGHPHMETLVEEPIIKAIASFERDHASQVLLIEGTQGVGKTNLLNYFQQELQEIYSGAEGHYIIRYYPDPESTFDGILRRIFQEFDAQNLLIKLADYLAGLSEPERDAAISIASSHEMRAVLKALMRATAVTDNERTDVTKAALEWLTGLRILKRHRDLLGVNFRLDTVESKTQALRDLVFCCSKAELLNGLYLLLDELEKQDYSYSKTVVLRYLSAIRALIDALPRHLFLLVALTIESRRRYFSWLPAFAGRLQNIVRIDPIKTADAAIKISDFYVAQARADARRELGVVKNKVEDLIPRSEVQEIFVRLLRQAAAEKAQEGVTPRDLLNSLHARAENTIASI